LLFAFATSLLRAMDEVVWHSLNHHHCSFKVKSQLENFCRNEYNITGLCRKGMCPLANSRYATVIEKEGEIYLYMKTIERAHLPSQMWERLKLSKNYNKALDQINRHLIHWPNHIQHRCKQRLTKITQYLIRTRKLRKKPRKKLVGITNKEERLHKKREQKALVAAKIDNVIQRKLVERLMKGGEEVVNIDQEKFEEVLRELESDSEEEIEYVADYEEELSDLEDGYEYEMEMEGDEKFEVEKQTVKRKRIDLQYED